MLFISVIRKRSSNFGYLVWGVFKLGGCGIFVQWTRFLYMIYIWSYYSEFCSIYVGYTSACSKFWSFSQIKKVVNLSITHYHEWFYIFRSTVELENFQNLILAYASKRHSYSPPVYRVRNRLAALDHNGHVERPLMTNKDGSSRYVWEKQKGQSKVINPITWTSREHTTKTHKNINHINNKKTKKHEQHRSPMKWG